MAVDTSKFRGTSLVKVEGPPSARLTIDGEQVLSMGVGEDLAGFAEVMTKWAHQPDEPPGFTIILKTPLRLREGERPGNIILAFVEKIPSKPGAMREFVTWWMADEGDRHEGHYFGFNAAALRKACGDYIDRVVRGGVREEE